MNLDHFHRQNAVLGRRIVALLTSGGETVRPQERLQEVSAALAIALELLRTAEAALRHRDEEVHASRASSASELQRYFDLFNFAPVGYLVTDVEGIVVEANHVATALLGAVPGDLAGHPLAGLLAESERPNFRRELDGLVQLGGTREWEARLPEGDGPPIDVVLTAATVGDWDVGPVALRWIVREVPTPGSPGFRPRAAMMGAWPYTGAGAANNQPEGPPLAGVRSRQERPGSGS